MSTQSGITASKQLLTAFKDLNHDFLIIKVNDNSTELINDEQAPKSKTSTINNRFEKLREYLESIHPQPVYIILSIDENYQEFAFISFIPDIAHIRDKMLYASTKNTLLTELGGNNIKKDYIFAWSELQEIEYEFYDSVRPDKIYNDKENDDDIDDKKLMEQIDSLQDISINDKNRFSKKLTSMDSGSNQLLFKFNNELTENFENAENHLIIFNIDKNETFQLLKSIKNINNNNLINEISSIDNSNPKFALYNYYEDKFAFIYSCPSGSKVRDRMIYASNKQGLVNFLKLKLNIDKVLEVGDIHELEINELIHSKEVKSDNSSLKFNKPKGPRRR